MPISKNSVVIVALIRQTRDVPAILKANGFKIQRLLKDIFKALEQGSDPALGDTALQIAVSSVLARS